MRIRDIFNRVFGTGLNSHDKKGKTRLYRAVRGGSTREVKKLLKAGADPGKPSRNGLSPLHLAAWWGETEIVTLLLKAGADPNVRNKDGMTPLHSAAISGGLKSRRDVINILTAAGARLADRDKSGAAPVDYMIRWEEDAVAADDLRRRLEEKISDIVLPPAAFVRPSSRPRLRA